MQKNIIRFYIGLAILFVVFTVVVFVVPYFEKTTVFWIAYIFALLAMAVQLYVQPKAFARKGWRSKFYGFPIARVGVIYLIVQLILSLVFMAIAAFATLWIEIILFIIALALAVLGFTAADAMRDEIERQDIQLNKNVDTMRSLQSKVNALIGQAAGMNIESEIKKLSENFKFSDPVSSENLVEIENELYASVDLLQQAVIDGDDDNALTLCRKVNTTLAERNRLCKLGK